MGLSEADFNRLVEQHSAALYRTAYRLMGDRYEAEDAVQDAFRSAWTSRARYEPDRGDRAWLMSMLRRRIADRWRRKRQPGVAAAETVVEPGVEPLDPTRDQYSDETQRALDQLPEVLREALLLVVVGELTHQEAAEVLDVPLGTVLSRVARARDRMRRLLSPAAPR